MQKQTEFADACKSKYPGQLVIAIAKDEKGKANPISLGLSMITSYTPPMIAIAVAAKHYSVECIRHSKCFTVAFPSLEQTDAVLFYGKNTGWDTDKFAKHPAATEPADQIDSVLLSDAVANFECELEWEKQSGDHIIFVGKVVCTHKNPEDKKRLFITGPKHKLGPANI